VNKPVRRIVAFIVLFALGAASGIGADRFWQSRVVTEPVRQTPSSMKPEPGADEEEPEPAAIVRTAVAIQGELQRTVEALGGAVVPPSASSIESWPTDVVVSRVLVQPGEIVAKDAPLVQVSVTRETETQAASAQLAVDSTAKSLELAQQRFERGLATRPEVLAAQVAHDEASQRLERLRAGLPPQDGVLRAHAQGIVGAMRAQAGSTVPAGTPILDIMSDAVVAQVGIDPADAAGIVVGQAFDVQPIDDRSGNHWVGTLSLMARAINPTTRLIDATLTLAGEALPRAGTPLRARAAFAGASGVLIPRAALVPDGDEMIVFVVRDGTAVRKTVTISQRGDEQVVLSGGCAPGDRVVVSG